MRIKITLYLLFLTCLTFAQTNAPINLDLLFELQKLEQSGQTDKVLHVLVKGDLEVIENTVRSLGGTYKHGLKDIASVAVPASGIRRMMEDPDITRIEYYKVEAKLLGDFIRTNNNLDSLHSGHGDLPQGLDGEGVLVAIMDTGMDWTHPDLQNADGTTRIKYIWDQIHPQINTSQYGYGYEWDEADINNGTVQHVPYDPPIGHGNGTAGAALGNGNAVPGEYIGAAPKADIIHVNLDLNGLFSNFVDGLDYVFKKADETGQPCVVNSSVGTYRGSHDTRGLETQMIENMLDEKPGRVLVQAAGNGATIRQHLGYEVTTDTVFSWFQVNVGNLGYVYYDLYADKVDFDNVYFSLGARKKSDFSLSAVSPFFNLQDDFITLPFTGMDSISYTLRDDVTNELLGEIQVFAELNQGVYDMAYIVYTVNNDYYWEFSTTGSGKFDVWSNGFLMGTSSILPPHLAPSESEFPDIEKHIFADTLKTIVSAWNCSEKVISVANYSNRTSWEGYDNMTYSHPTPAQHKIPASSIGPTRTGIQKPDIAASGDFTFAMQAVVRLQELATLPNEADRLAPEGWHARWAGTSISAPIVTGTVACYLQQFPNATYAEVKEGIQNSAKVDEYVLAQYGPVPNDAWGYGKLDGFNFVNNAVLAIDVENPLTLDVELYNTPNPFRDVTRIFYNINNFNNKNIEIRITDLMGRTIHSYFSDKKTDSFLLDTKKLHAGTYFYSLMMDNNIVQTKKMLMVND